VPISKFLTKSFVGDMTFGRMTLGIATLSITFMFH